MKIIVTDLTRFKNPDIVCLAGVDPDTRKCIRPMLSNQNKFEYLPFEVVKQYKIVPGSVLEGDFSQIASANVPHIEDHSFGDRLNMLGPSSAAEFERILDETSVATIRSGFGSEPDRRLYEIAKPPSLSIITLKLTHPRTQFRLTVETNYGDPKFKAHVIDGSGYEIKWLPVTDLGFSDHLGRIRVADPSLSGLNAFLQSQAVLYLRLGLTRAYAPDPSRNGYWVQVNGIYSFPNYREDLRIYD